MLSENTPVKLGAVCISSMVIVSVVWWASGVSSKLDTLVAGQVSTNAEMKALKEKVSDLNARVRVLERR